jgi:drug/metabolite transporter (DMT)-like permease
VPFTFALQTLLLRRYRNYDMMTSICMGGLLAFVLAIIGSHALGTGTVLNVNAHSIAVLGIMGVVQLAVPLVLYGWGARTVPAVSLALISMLDAVFNPLWSLIFVGERPETTSIIGGGIILGAVLLSILGLRLWSQQAIPQPGE